MKKLIFLVYLSTLTLFAQELSVNSENGIKLYGNFTKAKAFDKSKIVLLMHQFGSDATSWDTLVKQLSAEGYSTLAVDLRGHGKSILKDGKKLAFTPDLSTPSKIHESSEKLDKLYDTAQAYEDISLWIDALDKQGVDSDHLIAIGSSMGANALIKSLEDIEYKKLVLISIGEIEGAEMLLGVGTTPTLYISSINDALGSREHSLSYMPSTLKGKLLLLNGDKHGTANLAVASSEILEFVGR